MPEKNNKSKTGSSADANKSTANKNSKTKMTAAEMPAVPKANERAKTKDFNRRGDAESNEL